MCAKGALVYDPSVDEITRAHEISATDDFRSAPIEAFLDRLMLPGVQKGNAVESVLAEHGILPGEVVAFGDGLNDIELLEWAGRGIAAADAHPDVRRVADEVTVSNDDGVAIVVERLLG